MYPVNGAATRAYVLAWRSQAFERSFLIVSSIER
jgi:hypothetical protein